MASVSSATSSLGNTSLRGFGGMASGIDRDSLIEQMTLGTQTKISNKRKEITSAEWKQEAYRDVINQILDMEDKYYTYSSSESLMNRDFFSKNLVSVLGDPSVTKYITATGNSNALDYMSILGVKQMASAASLKSDSKTVKTSITTGITADQLMNTRTKVSNLAGTKLEFGNYGTDGRWISTGTFTFPSTYKDADGKDVTIDYTNSEGLSQEAHLKKLGEQLNEALKQANITDASKNNIAASMKFSFSADGAFQINCDNTDIKIRQNSSALTALGFKEKDGDDFSYSSVDREGGISFVAFNDRTSDFTASSVKEQSLADYMTGKKLSVTFAGQTKDIELVTKEELKEFDKLRAEYQAAKDANNTTAAEAVEKKAMDYLQKNIQGRLNKAFGGNDTDTNVEATVENGKLEFKLGTNFKGNPEAADAPTLIVTNSSAEVRRNLGIEAGASNKVSLDASLYENREKLGFTDEAAILAKVGAAYNNLQSKYQDLTKKCQDLEKGYNAWVDGLGDDQKPEDIKDANKPEDVLEYEKLKEELDQLTEDLDEKGITELVASGRAYDDLSSDEKNTLDVQLHKEAFNELLQEMSINGVTGKDLKITSDTSVNQFMNTLNANEDAGVKATFLSATSEFVLVASETGSGRTFDLTGAAATIFGDPTDSSRFTAGQNAEMTVSYGGIPTTVTSSSNTFNLDGLTVTVSGKFGEYDETTGAIKEDFSKAINFSSKADVDAATERVKKFIETYNELVSRIDKEITTKPDSDYGPLTEEQKDEMDDTSIENWEKKAKEGLLFGDSYLRELSMDLQSMMVSLINDGINPNDLESIGITASSDWYSGGQLEFDESKFRQAMAEDPDKVADIMCGGGDVKTGLAATIGNKLSTYATHFSYKHNGSNGSLVEVAGTDRISSSLTKNQIYDQLKQMQQDLENLKSLLSSEQDRYIKQFSTMENLISQMNSQSSYFSSLSAG